VGEEDLIGCFKLKLDGEVLAQPRSLVPPAYLYVEGRGGEGERREEGRRGGREERRNEREGSVV
jgi:hypothetical protein